MQKNILNEMTAKQFIGYFKDRLKELCDICEDLDAHCDLPEDSPYRSHEEARDARDAMWRADEELDGIAAEVHQLPDDWRDYDWAQT